jgi:hypothetical protein
MRRPDHASPLTPEVDAPASELASSRPPEPHPAPTLVESIAAADDASDEDDDDLSRGPLAAW